MNPSSSGEMTEAAKKILSSLILTKKHYSLYPDDHTICTNALDHLQRLFEDFLHRHSIIRFDIERGRILSQGEVVLSEPPEEGALSFTLFRDGIRWLEFAKGIDSGELKKIISIINKYSILSDKSDSDIVTAFWEARFPHMRYEVTDFSWSDSQETPPAPRSDSAHKWLAILHENILADLKPKNDLPIDQAEIEVTSVEEVMMQQMICMEEDASPTAHLDALFDSLLQYREQENFKVILAVLDEEFKGSISRKDFEGAHKILENLQCVLDRCKANTIPKAVQCIEDFYLSLSDAKSLDSLKNVWPDLDPGQCENVNRVLKFFRPEAIPTLAAMLEQSRSSHQQQMLIEVIVSLASTDMRPLEDLMKHSDEKLVQRLVNVLASMKGEQPLKALMSLIRHPSERVRQEAIRGVFQQDHTHSQEIFTLIDDKDKSVRKLVLKHMGQSRNQATEKFLLNYLEHRVSEDADSEHTIACFTALGQCGSSRSVPFLRRTLYSRKWIPSFGKPDFCKGAVIALDKIGTNEARQVLEDAGRSLYPAVRLAVRKNYL